MRRKSHCYGTRESAPRYNARPLPAATITVIAEAWATIAATTDRRAVERPCKLRRLSDGATRIVFPSQMGRPATHGYQVVCIDDAGDDFVTLRTTEMPSDEYTVLSATWVALDAKSNATARKDGQ